MDALGWAARAGRKGALEDEPGFGQTNSKRTSALLEGSRRGGDAAEPGTDADADLLMGGLQRFGASWMRLAFAFLTASAGLMLFSLRSYESKSWLDAVDGQAVVYTIAGLTPAEKLQKGSLEALEREHGVGDDVPALDGKLKELVPRGYSSSKKDCEPVKRLPTVFVVSNRRSGTHATMDMIFNVFEQDMVIMKTNHPAATGEELKCKCLNWMRRTGKIVHPHRNIFDVVVSMYQYRQTYDAKFRHVSFDEYMKGKFLNYVIRRWVDTVHSWYLMEDVLDIQFANTLKPTPEHVQRIADFLGLEWHRIHSVTGNDVLNRRNWTEASHPVQARREFKGYQIVSNETAQIILDKVREIRRWGRKTPLMCEPEVPAADLICKSKITGRTFLDLRESNCFVIGSTAGKPLLGDPQTSLCIPRACPKDMWKGLVVTRFKGKVLTSRQIKVVRP